MADLGGRRVVLAGGTGGLGAATAKMLAADGARLVIGFSRDAARADQVLQDCGSDAVLCQADIRTAQGREALLDSAPDLYGLVVLVGDPARAADEDTLRRSLDVNYLAPSLLARQAAERMRAAGTPGAIVLLASMQAVHVFENSAPYSAPKVALVHAARVLAKEFGGPANIRVNVVAPGVTTAGMAEASVASGKYDRFLESGVIARFGRAEDVARAIRFLLEPDSYITGQVLVVDGGLTLRRDLQQISPSANRR
jgi:NAD(P)-dependent dehydrogenase (short-subunit alcohol dehydrogenase family)